jgi:hypothetical protein
MRNVFDGVLTVGFGLLLGATTVASAAADAVTKDPKGRVLTRSTTNQDQTRHLTSYQYAADGDRALVVVDEDFDKSGRATRRVEQRFDLEGRLLEKLDVQLDEQGKPKGTRTRYAYDPSGKRSEQVTPLN